MENLPFLWPCLKPLSVRIQAKTCLTTLRWKRKVPTDDIFDCRFKSLDWWAGRANTLRRSRPPIRAFFRTSRCRPPRRSWDIGRAETWAARLWAMLLPAVATMSRKRALPFPPDEKENDCSLNAVRVAQSGRAESYSGRWFKSSSGQHSGNSGFPFLLTLGRQFIQEASKTHILPWGVPSVFCFSLPFYV